MARLFIALIAAGILISASAAAFAHGGSYRGPQGEVPPGARDPSDPQPPPEPGGVPTGPNVPPPITPPGDDPTPGDSPDPRTPPRQPSAPVAPPGGPLGPRPGVKSGGGGAPPLSYENWIFWWASNRDEIVNLKTALRRMQQKTATDNSANFFGEGGEGNRKSIDHPTAKMIRRIVVPALERVIADRGMHDDIRGGAVIALARCETGARYVRDFVALARGDDKEAQLVRESAVLALGILQLPDPLVRDFLVETLADRNVPFRIRCFAAFSLGLLRDHSPEVFKELEARVGESEKRIDVRVCSLIAIGLLGNPENVPTLLDWLEKRAVRGHQLKDLELAHLVGALGKIGDPRALPAIEKVLRKRGTLTRRSAAIALGQLLPKVGAEEQAKAVRRIDWLLGNESDATTRNFAVISLGRLAGSEGVGARARDEAVKVMTRVFTEGQKIIERPFAALGLGLACFEGPGSAPKPSALKYEVGRLLRTTLEKLKGDKASLGALAIGLGMVGVRDSKTTVLLRRILADRGMDPTLRGTSAIALGLIGDPESRPLVRKVLAERQDRKLRVDSAVAAGLLLDPKAVLVLVDVLNDPKASQFSLGSVALALGQIGDSRAVDPLLRLLEPDHSRGQFPDLTRALVAVALGQMANPRDVRILSRISTDINYRASVPALEEVLTIL